MGLVQHRCYSVACDSCYDEEPNGEYITHWPSDEEALAFARESDWVVRLDAEGSIRGIYCETCWDAMDEVEKADA